MSDPEWESLTEKLGGVVGNPVTRQRKSCYLLAFDTYEWLGLVVENRLRSRLGAL